MGGALRFFIYFIYFLVILFTIIAFIRNDIMTNKQNLKVNKGLIAKTLDWAYDRALSGFGGVDSAYALAHSYMEKDGSLEEQVDSLIKWQVSKAAASGFLTGIGGVMTLPITIPANIASVIYLQIRMITAIAHMGGHDVNSDKVRALVYISMVGNGAKELLKDVGVKAAENLVSKILIAIQEKVSVKLASKLGVKSASSLGKLVPIAGGVVGGAFDAVSTRTVGKIAKRIFIKGDAL